MFAKYASVTLPLLLTLLLAGPMSAQNRSSRTGQRSATSESQTATDSCSLGRFVSQDELERVIRMRTFESMTQLTRVKHKVEFPPSCGYDIVNQEMVKLASCPAQSYQSMFKKVRRSSYSSCCQTTMYVTQPMEVSDLYSGNTYTVVHHPTSYQLLHSGYCANEGAACGVGTCTQGYRVDWVLVEKPTGNDFVPTMVPNHCFCVYT